jgi:[acyl-carrier-protein] S-malonyltransferase
MGRDFFDNFETARKIFEEADNSLSAPLSKIIFDGTEEELKQTSITQVAVLTVEVAILSVLREKNIQPSVVAGHSLGEYSALIAAKVLNFSDALPLVQKRAKFMEEAGLKKPSGMLAVIGLDEAQVNVVCSEASRFGIVEVANFNSSGQIVLSGHIDSLREAEKIAETKGAKKCVFLTVSGAFHSSLMDEASVRLSAELQKINIAKPEIPFIANFTGDYISDPEKIRESLGKQVNNSVRWTQVMHKVLESGADTVIEVGPGRVLSGLWKRFDREKKLLNIEDTESFEAILSQL